MNFEWPKEKVKKRDSKITFTATVNFALRLRAGCRSCTDVRTSTWKIFWPISHSNCSGPKKVDEEKPLYCHLFLSHTSIVTSRGPYVHSPASSEPRPMDPTPLGAMGEPQGLAFPQPNEAETASRNDRVTSFGWHQILRWNVDNSRRDVTPSSAWRTLRGWNILISVSCCDTWCSSGKERGPPAPQGANRRPRS